MDRVEEIVDGDPAHPLVARADWAAEADAEWREHLRQSSAGGGQDYAEAEVNDARSVAGERLGRGFPGAADVGEEAGAFTARLVEDFVAAVAVDADCGGRHQDARRPRERGQRFAEDAGAVGAAVHDPALSFQGPSAAGDVFAGEV